MSKHTEELLQGMADALGVAGYAVDASMATAYDGYLEARSPDWPAGLWVSVHPGPAEGDTAFVYCETPEQAVQHVGAMAALLARATTAHSAPSEPAKEEAK